MVSFSVDLVLYILRGTQALPVSRIMLLSFCISLTVGTQYILFAVNEPRLFQILFMSEHGSVPDLDNVLPMIDESYERILSSITAAYGMRGEMAERLYRHLWIYTHGIATLCATRMCRFSGEEISNMMTEVCKSLLKYMGEGDGND